MIPFRFDAETHRYEDLATGRVLPSITQMLKAAGLIDTRFYTDEGRDRGSAVHELTAAYDLGGLHLGSCVAEFKPYLQHYALAIGQLNHDWKHIEVAFAHPVYRYAGRPDRVGSVFGGLKAVAEIKTGAPEKWHGVQLALQCMLVEEDLGLPAHTIARFGIYVSAKTCHIDQYRDLYDFVRAKAIAAKHGGR